MAMEGPTEDEVCVPALRRSDRPLLARAREEVWVDASRCDGSASSSTSGDRRRRQPGFLFCTPAPDPAVVPLVLAALGVMGPDLPVNKARAVARVWAGIAASHPTGECSQQNV